MSQSNLLMIPIDESILLPMDSLEQHLADSSKPNVIGPILRNILLQYGDQSAFESLNYAETLPQEPVQLHQEFSEIPQEQIALKQENIPLALENIILPLGLRPCNYVMNSVALEDETQEIAFIRRTNAEKRTIEKTQIIKNTVDEIQQQVKAKASKRPKLSIEKIVKNLPITQSEIKEPTPSTSAGHNVKTEQVTDQSSTFKKKKKNKKNSKRKDMPAPHDKEPNKKKLKKDPLVNKSEKINDTLGKEAEKRKNPKEVKGPKTSSSEKKNSSKKRTLKKDVLAPVKESTESTVDVKEEMSNTKKKKSVKRQSNNDSLLKTEEDGNGSISSPAKRSRNLKVDLTDPIYLEPFKYGWTREVVYRSAQKSGVKKADTYYYLSGGKKFRTRKEMSDILSKHKHLTEDNFTYVPRPLGINDSTKELVRHSHEPSFKKMASSKKTSSKSRKSGQDKDSSQKDNISSSNSEQNSDVLVPKNVEDRTRTRTYSSQLQKENKLDGTNDSKAKISDATGNSKEVAVLDNDKYLDTEETSNQKMLSNAVESNSVTENTIHNIQNNENKNESDGECIKDIDSSKIMTNTDHSTEKSEIDFLKTVDLVTNFDKEIKSSSYNSMLDESNSDKEYEPSDTEENTNEYGDDPTESEYKSKSLPEKSLEELNSSFSEKISISGSLENSKNVEIKDNKEKNSLKEIGPDNLISEKTAEVDSNLECIDEVSALKSSSTSPDTVRVGATNETTNLIQKIDIENLTVKKISQNIFEHEKSINNEIKTSNDSKSNKVSVLANLTTSLDTTDVSATIEATNSLQETVTENFVCDTALKNNLEISSANYSIEISNDLKPKDFSQPESSLISTEATKGNAVDEKTNSLQIINSENSDIEETSENNLTCTKSTDNELEVSSDLKPDKVSVLNSTLTLADPVKVNAIDNETDSDDLHVEEMLLLEYSSISSDSMKVNAVDEKTNLQRKSDADSSTENDTLKSNINRGTSIDSGMEITSTKIISLMSCSLSTTQSVTSSNSSADFVASTVQSSDSGDRLSVALSTTAEVSQSLSDVECASSSSNAMPKIAPESTDSVETSLASLISTTTTVATSNTTNSLEMSIPLDGSVLDTFQSESVNDVKTSKAENAEKTTDMIDMKDNFSKVKTKLDRGIEMVEQGLYNSSELLSTDAAENTYLVNTEGNRFSFSTATFKQSTKLLPKKETDVSQFKDDVDCMKTVAESIKALSSPSDLTDKQYSLNFSDILTNENMKNQSFSEMKFDNTISNVNQTSSQEKNVDKLTHVSCSKENLKNYTRDCIQNVKSPSLVISCSKNVILGLDNSIVNKSEKLISEKDESSELRKMNTDLDQTKSVNSSEISDPICSSNLSVKNRESTIKSLNTVSKDESAEDHSDEFVRSESYEYQNSSRDEDTENFKNSSDSSGTLDNTVILSDTLSEDSSQNNLTEYSNSYENNITATYEDYLLPSEFPIMTDQLQEKTENASDELKNEENLIINNKEINTGYVNVTDSMELHNDLCEFINLPPKIALPKQQLVINEQVQNKNDPALSNVIPFSAEELSTENNNDNFPKELFVDQNLQLTCASETSRKSNLCEFNTLPAQQLLNNSESNLHRVEEKNVHPILSSTSATVLASLTENNDDCAIDNLPDGNLQKFSCANNAIEKSVSFECTENTLVELDQLLEMSNENQDEIDEIVLRKLLEQKLNVSSRHSNKLEEENSKFKVLIDSPITPGCSIKFSLIKSVYQSTPSSNSEHKTKKYNFQSRLSSPHSMTSFCAGYRALKHIFEYLNFEDLLKAMDVCTVWKDIAQQPHLWKTIRIRNSQLTHRLAKNLHSYGTEHLLVVEEDSPDWRNFINVFSEIKSLRIIELCPCPAEIFEQIVKNCPQLKIVKALSLKDESVNVESIQSLSNPEELHLGGLSSISMKGDLSFLSGFSNLTHLSLRSIKDLGKKNMNIIESLQELQSLELGECSKIMNTFGSTTLVVLKNLKRLRLEKVAGLECCEDILTSVSKMKKLIQLELVDIEVNKSVLSCLPTCKNIKKLLIIPANKERIPFSNAIIIRSSTKLRNLTRFVWGIPEEFKQESESFCKRPYDDCISVLKPIPFKNILQDIAPDYAKSTSAETDLCKMLPLDILKEIYTRVLPNTHTDILKIPIDSTCNLSM